MYVVLIRYLYEGFNSFFKRPEARTQKRAEGIKPLNTNKKHKIPCASGFAAGFAAGTPSGIV